MSDWGNLLRSAWRHAKRSRQLAAESMLEVAECHRITASTYEKVMGAAQPFLDLAELNAELAQAYANSARRTYNTLCGIWRVNLRQPVSVN